MQRCVYLRAASYTRPDSGQWLYLSAHRHSQSALFSIWALFVSRPEQFNDTAIDILCNSIVPCDYCLLSDAHFYKLINQRVRERELERKNEIEAHVRHIFRYSMCWIITNFVDEKTPRHSNLFLSFSIHPPRGPFCLSIL